MRDSTDDSINAKIKTSRTGENVNSVPLHYFPFVSVPPTLSPVTPVPSSVSLYLPPPFFAPLFPFLPLLNFSSEIFYRLLNFRIVHTEVTLSRIPMMSDSSRPMKAQYEFVPETAKRNLHITSIVVSRSNAAENEKGVNKVREDRQGSKDGTSTNSLLYQDATRQTSS